MSQSPNSFRYFKVDVETDWESYDALSLLDKVVDGLKRRKLVGHDEDLLLTGVRGTRRLILDRTHDDRFYTFAVPLSQLVEVEKVDALADPFYYAEQASVRAPTLMVYDPAMLDMGTTPEREMSAFGKRFLATFNRDVEEDLGMGYGIGEGNLDPATRAVILLKPVYSSHR